MPEKRKNSRRGWNLFLAVHLFLYVIAWCLAIYALATLNIAAFSADYTQFIAAVMLWLPILALHIMAYLRSGRKQISPESERQAYRDGFTDAMKHLADRSVDMEHLMLDDEGELVEVPQKRKRREV